jgi:hypothetical protein
MRRTPVHRDVFVRCWDVVESDRFRGALGIITTPHAGSSYTTTLSINAAFVNFQLYSQAAPDVGMPYGSARWQTGIVHPARCREQAICLMRFDSADVDR